MNLVEIDLLRLGKWVMYVDQGLVPPAYSNGRYGDILNYKKAPKPRLKKPDAEWANRLLSEAKLR